jgi:arsenite-transporting ATPase
LPILQVPLLETEVVGLPLLERVAAAAFGEGNPGEVRFAGRAEEVRREAGSHVLDLAVPFVARGDVQLSQRGDELTVHVGSYKHKTLLPRTLAGRPVLGARLAEQRLVIRFGERPTAVAGKGR